MATVRPEGLKPSLHSIKQSKDRDSPSTEARPPAKRRRYVLPLPVDDETGEVLDTATRKSSRNATVASKRQLHSKLKDELEKRVCIDISIVFLPSTPPHPVDRNAPLATSLFPIVGSFPLTLVPIQASQPKKHKPAARPLTQAELIAEALETEEINTSSLNDFLTEEEERQARNSNLKREAVEGPLLRFVSRGEKVKTPVVAEVEMAGPTPSYAGYRHPYTPGPLPNTAASSSKGIHGPVSPIYAAYGAGTYARPVVMPTNSTAGPSKGMTPFSSSPYYRPLPAPPRLPASGGTLSAPGVGSVHGQSKTVTQAKNYVILETPGVSPSEDYKYLFGGHVDWGNLRVLPKLRPAGEIHRSACSIVPFYLTCCCCAISS